MPLAAPTGLTISRLRRINTGPSLDYYADLSWTNNEANNHFVVVTLETPANLGKPFPSSYTLTRNANKLDSVSLFGFLASQSANTANVTVSVQVKSATDQSTVASVTRQLALSEVGTVVGSVGYDGQGGLDLPTWSGVVEIDPSDNWGSVSYSAIGVSQIGSVNGERLPKTILWNVAKFSKDQLAFSEIYRWWNNGIDPVGWVISGGFSDGGFYSATINLRVARLPERSGSVWVNSFNTVIQGTAFEYYRNGPTVPVFTSPLSVDVFVDDNFTYTPSTAGPATFAANFGTNSNLTFGTATNTVSGVFSQVGNFSFSITATNAQGNKTETVSVKVLPFTASNVTVRSARNVLSRTQLITSHRAIWSILGQGLSGFSLETVPVSFGTAVGPDETYLVGSHENAGAFNISLSASRVGVSPAQTSTATASVNIVEALANTTVSGNAGILRDGLTVAIGTPVSIAFSSQPSPAVWSASGLPPGLIINQQGQISGTPSEEGTFFSAITAQADGLNVSTAAGIRFIVTPRAVSVARGSTAAERSPWLLQQWELIDLHVDARNRSVQSTLFEKDALRIKLGDALNFAVFFVDPGSAVFQLAPTQLRLTIRRANNLDDLIIFKSLTPPQSATNEGQTYYLMPVTTSNREREVALEWAEENGKNEPLQCVADLDWTKDGKLYSSRTFPVLLELDVTRP